MSNEIDEKSRWQYEFMEKLDAKLDKQINLLSSIKGSLQFFVVLAIFAIIIQSCIAFAQ